MGLDYNALKPKDLSHLSASNNGGVGLIAAYNMIPSPNATLVDISGGGNDGALQAASGGRIPISFTDGLHFNNSRVYLGASEISIGNVSTFAVRIKLNDGTVNAAMLRQITVNDDQFLIKNIDVTFRVSDVAVSLNYAFQEGKWYNVVMVRVDQVLNLYVNGVLVDSDTIANSDSYGFEVIGNPDGVLETYYDLADFQIFNYAFSEAEAVQYHNSFQKITKRGNFTLDGGVGDTIG